MKTRILVCLNIMILIFGLLFVKAEGERKFKLTGSDTVTSGDTLVITIKIDGSDIFGCQAILEYNPDQLDLKGAVLIQNEYTEEWTYQEMDGLEAGELGFLLDDKDLSRPINGEVGIIGVSFNVKDLEDGTKVKVRLKNQVIAYNYGDQEKPADVEFETTVVKKVLSENDFLKSLKVTNGNLSPTFNKNTQNYTVSVPYSVSKLQFTALCEDDKSTLQVNNPDLAAGGKTNVTITVVSEANTKRVYTIQVTRAEKPAEVKSNNNKLQSLETGYPLSPLFHPDITEYTMEVPHDIKEVTLSLTVQDTKCTYVIEGGKDFEVGENVVKVICTAEDGSVRNYTILVTREEDEQAATSPTDEPDASPTPEETETSSPTVPPESPGLIVVSDPSGMPYWLVIVLIIIFTGVGFMFGVTINVRGSKEYYNDDDDFDGNIVETDFDSDVKEVKKKDSETLFILEDSLKDYDK